MKIKINNFQSIEDCTLDLPEKSFTCIVGPTNIGKSSIRRAMECVFYNQSEASYIRKGAKECSVEVTLVDGCVIKWQRDKKTVKYEIDGKTYAKLNQTVPEPIIAKGFRELIINKEKFNVQISDQFSNIFLLNQTGSKVTEVLSNLGNLNKIIAANKACSIDLKNHKSKLKIRREDLFASKEKVKNYAGLDEQRNRSDELKLFLEEIKNKRKLYDSGFKLKDKLNKKLVVVKSLKEANNYEIDHLNIDIIKFFDLQKMYKKYKISLKVSESYKPIAEQPDISFDLDEENRLLDKLSVLYKKYKDTNNKITLYKDLPEDVENTDIDAALVSKLKSLYNKVQDKKVNLIRLREQVKEQEEKLVSLEQQKIEIMKDIKICPLCDSELK